MTRQNVTLFDLALMQPAIADAFRKLDPRVQWRNPVMFVVFIGSILTTLAAVPALSGPGREPTAFIPVGTGEPESARTWFRESLFGSPG